MTTKSATQTTKREPARRLQVAPAPAKRRRSSSLQVAAKSAPKESAAEKRKWAKVRKDIMERRAAREIAALNYWRFFNLSDLAIAAAESFFFRCGTLQEIETTKESAEDCKLYAKSCRELFAKAAHDLTHKEKARCNKHMKFHAATIAKFAPALKRLEKMRRELERMN